MGRQWPGRYGKTGNRVVTVTTIWAGERIYYPVQAMPYTPARHFAKGKNDPAFRTELAIGAGLAIWSREVGFAFRAVVADSAYGDQDRFRGDLAGTARALAWGGPDDPGDWTAVARTFRDGHAETWRAAGAKLGGWGPDGVRRLVVATADPGILPDKATWYLVTKLPRPGGPREPDSPCPAADLAEIVRLHGIRNWIEQSYKQVKDELGWASFQVRSDIAIRRHQVLVNCAFSFCWAAWFAHPAPQDTTPPAPQASGGEREPRTSRATAVLAPRAPVRARLARPVDRAAALVDGLVERAPALRSCKP